jgi:hypothetical protein
MSRNVNRFGANYQRSIAASFVAFVAATAFATPASADDQSFLNDVRASGMPVMYEPY